MNNKGFTLIELMVVVGIVAVLSAVGIPQYNRYRINARRAECLSTSPLVLKSAAAFVAESGLIPCNIGTRANKNSIADAACSGAAIGRTIEFPVAGVGINDNSKMFFSYNIGPGGVNSAGNAVDWFPNNDGAQDNKFGAAVAIAAKTSSDAIYTEEAYVVSCNGTITSGQTNNRDNFTLPSSGEVFTVWVDAVKDVDYGAVGVDYALGK